MTAPLPSPEDVAHMRERHVRVPRTWPYVWCQHDGQDWPCDAARLLVLVDLRDKIAAATRDG